MLSFKNIVLTTLTRTLPHFCAYYLLQVVAFCSDSESKMVLLQKKLKERFEERKKQENGGGRDLIVYGCAAHYLNLVETEVTPKTVLKFIVEVQKYFRNHHQPLGWLREKKTTTSK